MLQRSTRFAPPLCAVFLALATVALAGPQDGLLLQLPFDGSFEPTVGKDVGPAVAKGKPAFVAGRHGQAVSLTGRAHVVVPLPSAVQSGEFSFTFWLKPMWHPQDGLSHPILDIPAAPASVDKVGWAPRQIFVSKGWSETIGPNYVYGVTDSGIARLHLKPGQWTHVALVYSAKGKFTATYFDGEGGRRPYQDKEAFNVHESRAWLGSRSNGQGGGDIVIDDFRMYGRAIGPEEIPAIAGATFPPPRNYLMLGNECDPAKAVETPHVSWAKPYAGGRAKVICISEGKRARDFIELAQRVDFEPITFTMPSMSKYTLANMETFHAVANRIEQRLAKRDVDAVIIAAFGWNLLPDSTRDAIMALVRSGGGLLLVDPLCAGGPGVMSYFGHGIMVGWQTTPLGKQIEKLVGRLGRDDEEYLIGSTPWGELTAYRPTLDTRRPETFFRGGKVGKGRVLVFDIYTGAANSRGCLTPGIMYTTDDAFDPFDYDYEIGAVGKALLWTCQRDSAVRITGLRYRDMRHPRPILAVGASGQWEVTLTSRLDHPANAQLKLTVRPKGPDSPTEAVRNVNLKPGETRVSLPTPIASIGKVFADARLLVDGKVADWASTAITARHGNPWFDKLCADKPAYRAEDSPLITADVVFKTYGVAHGERGELDWRLFDAYGRMIRRGAQPFEFNPYDEGAARVTWRLERLDASCLHYELVVDLVRNKRKTDQRLIVLRRYRGGVDDYVFTVWGGLGRSAAGSLATLVLRDRYGLGCTAVPVSGNPINKRFTNMLDLANRYNLRPWVYATHLGGKPDNNHVRTPDMFDPRFVRLVRDRVARVARTAQPYSPLYYSLGDEVKLGPPRAQASKLEAAAFAEYLRAKYANVQTLNATWGLHYKAWKDVVIPTYEEMKSLSSPLVNELITFREHRLARLCGIGAEAARSVEPAARVGIEGIFGLRHAWGRYDYAPMAAQSSFMGMYAYDFELDMVRSFQQPGDLLGIWWNYSKLDPGYSRFGPWHLLLHGGQTFMWYTTLEGSQYTALDPDFSPFDQFAWTHEELAPILDGIGKLVLGLKRDDLGLLVLYEKRDLDRNSPTFLSCQNLLLTLEDLGVQYDFISSQQAAQGQLAQRQPKLLLLPGQFAMGPRAAEAILRYVAAGGAVLADIRPAVSNGYKRYAKRPLDDIFAPSDKLRAKFPPASKDDLAAWAAHRMRYKQGRTMLLGGYVKRYGRERHKPRGRWFRELVRGWLAACGVEPQFRVSAAHGALVPRTMVSFSDGPARYVGIQRDYRSAVAGAVAFDVVGPAKSHVYDCRAGRYLGETDRVEVSLEPARSTLLAFLPYRVQGIDVRARPQVRQGEAEPVEIRLATQVGAPTRGVFRIEVKDAKGARVAALCRKVRWADGLASVKLQTAYNDPVGAWTLRVTDVATGAATSLKFTLAPAH